VQDARHPGTLGESAENAALSDGESVLSGGKRVRGEGLGDKCQDIVNMVLCQDIDYINKCLCGIETNIKRILLPLANDSEESIVNFVNL
jgi:hypothetical protein